MTSAASIGRNIQQVRLEKNMTQREVCDATGISTSQLSAYENGRQMVGLVSLAKIAVALGTSIDRLYFGRSSEAFINQSDDFGETVVNCFRKLEELGVVSDVSYTFGSNETSARLESCGPELSRLFSSLQDFNFHKKYYSDETMVLEQIYKSVANEINANVHRSK